MERGVPLGVGGEVGIVVDLMLVGGLERISRGVD